ncbi:MAG: hypothetical protein ACP5M7_10315, partial [Thermoproteota archaeon]
MTTSKTYTNVYVYNFATSSFNLLSATAYNSTTRVSYSTSITSSSNYFDASGNFKLRVNYTYPTGLTSTPAKLDIDILKITFKYYNGTSVTLTATASITLPYSTQTLKNITFQGISTYSGIARSINVTLTNSGGAKIATGAFTPSASWQTFSIPINTNASGTLTVKVILYALSSASANEEVTVKDIKLFGCYITNPSSSYIAGSMQQERINNTFSFTPAMPSSLNLSIIYFKIPAKFTFNKTDYATAPSYVGNETINGITYRVYKIQPATSATQFNVFFLMPNIHYNVVPLYKGATVSKLLVGEKIYIPSLSAPANISIGSYKFSNTPGNFYFKIPASGSYDVVINTTDAKNWNLGYFKTTFSAVLGSFSVAPKDVVNNALSYAQLSAYLYNTTSCALVSSSAFTTSTTFSNLPAGNYTVKLYYKNLLVGVTSFNLVSSTNATSTLPKIRTFRVVDYRGSSIGKVLAYSYGANLTEADISKGKAFPRGIYQLKVNGTGSFTLFVDYLGNLPTRIAIVSNASSLSYGWRGSILIINGTLGSTAVVNVTDLYKVTVDVRDMLERSLSFVPIT